MPVLRRLRVAPLGFCLCDLRHEEFIQPWDCGVVFFFTVSLSLHTGLTTNDENTVTIRNYFNLKVGFDLCCWCLLLSFVLHNSIIPCNREISKISLKSQASWLTLYYLMNADGNLWQEGRRGGGTPYFLLMW